MFVLSLKRTLRGPSSSGSCKVGSLFRLDGSLEKVGKNLVQLHVPHSRSLTGTKLSFSPRFTKLMNPSTLFRRSYTQSTPNPAEQTTPTPTNPTPPTKTLKDVWWLVPNVLGYFRIFLGTAVLWLPTSWYMLAAGMYFTCHFLDLFDGQIARKLNQTSQFGAVLDYTSDVVCHTSMLMALATVMPSQLLPLAIVMMVEVTGCVVSMYLTASGNYWKNTDEGTPFLLKKVIVNQNYTTFGKVMLMIYQAFFSVSWVLANYPVQSPSYQLVQGLWALLLPGAIINFLIHYSIAYEGIRKWKE